MSSHRAEVRPRYGRIVALAASVGVTTVALVASLAGVGSSSAQDGGGQAAQAAAATLGTPTTGPTTGSTIEPTTKPVTEPVSGPTTGLDPTTAEDPTALGEATTEPVLPARSGSGRRVVFSESEQQVWLVEGDGTVARTYPVSGSVYDNLDPGTFEVYSRSEDAYGIDDSGTMKFFVRFTQGTEGSAIGFHDIPVKDGTKIQSVADLGTPTSHGCIRQRRSDAKAMWAFAPLGTTVVVTP